jgi:mRNA interferase MazF
MNRGDVFEFRVQKTQGHKQSGVRLGVVVQSDLMNKLSTVLVAPTSKSARAASFRPLINIGGEETKVLVEQIAVADSQRLGRKVGSLSAEELWSLDDAISLVMGLG